MYWEGKIEGEFRNLWSMTKTKVIRNFGWWKSRNFSGKGQIVKIFLRVFENRGKSETGRKMHHGLRGDGRPWLDIQTNTTCEGSYAIYSYGNSNDNVWIYSRYIKSCAFTYAYHRHQSWRLGVSRLPRFWDGESWGVMGLQEILYHIIIGIWDENTFKRSDFSE